MIGATGGSAGAVVALTAEGTAHLGDLLGFLGALLGAAVTVAGAFYVSDLSARQERKRARQFLIDVARGIEDDMGFLQLAQACQFEDDDAAAISRRMDLIAAGLPQTAALLTNERFEVRAGDIKTIAAALRFKAALQVAEPEFTAWDRQRRSERAGFEYSVIINVKMMPRVLSELRTACREALQQL